MNTSFDRQLSHRLDALIVQIERRPSPSARYVKALLESTVPAFGQKVRAA